MMTLSDLKPGQSGTIVGWTDDTPPARLLEFGLVEGTRIELIRYAPLGDPLEIKLRGFHLTLRKSEAACIRLDTSSSD